MSQKTVEWAEWDIHYITVTCKATHTAISRKVIGKNVHATIPKGNMGYDQDTVPDTVAVETNLVTFL